MNGRKLKPDQMNSLILTFEILGFKTDVLQTVNTRNLLLSKETEFLTNICICKVKEINKKNKRKSHWNILFYFGSLQFLIKGGGF